MDAQSLSFFFSTIPLLLLSLLLIKLFFSSNPKLKSAFPPSLPSLPIIGHLHLIQKPIHQSISALSAKFGPIIYLQLGFRRTVVISSPQLAEECFTSNDVALANRPHFPSIKEVTNNYSTVIFSNYGPLWRNLRKSATVHVLSGHRLLSSTAARQEESRHLACKLFLGSGENKSAFKKINVREVLFEFVLNVIMGMIAGKRYYGEEANNWEEASQFRNLVEQVALLALGTKLEDFFPFLKPVIKQILT